MRATHEGKAKRMRRLVPLLLTLLLLPAGASAAGGPAALIKDCQDDKIDGTYTARDYRDAQRRLPTDVDEYTTCRETLRSAQLRAAAAGAPRDGGRGADRMAGAPGVAGSRAQPGSVTAAPAASIPPGSTSGEDPSGVPAAAVPGLTGAARTPTEALPDGALGAAAAVGGADSSGALLAPVAVATGAGDDVPPTLALVLAAIGTALLAAAAVARRQRRA